MRTAFDARFALPGRFAGLAMVLISAFALAGCASSGSAGAAGGTASAGTAASTKSEGGLIGKLFGNDKKSAIDPKFFLDTGYCPPLTVRTGTESIALREKKDGGPETVRFQAAINDTARECHSEGEKYNIKLGISGRLVAGPKGAAGKVSLPLRIVAIKGIDTVIYSNLFRFEVAMGSDLRSADFRNVFDIELTLTADDRDIRLHVGFDESGKSDPLTKPPAAKPAIAKAPVAKSAAR